MITFTSSWHGSTITWRRRHTIFCTVLNDCVCMSIVYTTSLNMHTFESLLYFAVCVWASTFWVTFNFPQYHMVMAQFIVCFCFSLLQSTILLPCVMPIHMPMQQSTQTNVRKASKSVVHVYCERQTAQISVPEQLTKGG